MPLQFSVERAVLRDRFPIFSESITDSGEHAARLPRRHCARAGRTESDQLEIIGGTPSLPSRFRWMTLCSVKHVNRGGPSLGVPSCPYLRHFSAHSKKVKVSHHFVQKDHLPFPAS